MHPEPPHTPPVIRLLPWLIVLLVTLSLLGAWLGAADPLGPAGPVGSEGVIDDPLQDLEESRVITPSR